MNLKLKYKVLIAAAGTFILIFRNFKRAIIEPPIHILVPYDNFKWCGVSFFKDILKRRKNLLYLNYTKVENLQYFLNDSQEINYSDKVILIGHPNYPRFDGILTNGNTIIRGNWFYFSEKKIFLLFALVCHGAIICDKPGFNQQFQNWISFSGQIRSIKNHLPKAQFVYKKIFEDILHCIISKENPEKIYVNMKSIIFDTVLHLEYYLSERDGLEIVQLHLNELHTGLTFKTNT